MTARCITWPLSRIIFSRQTHFVNHCRRVEQNKTTNLIKLFPSVPISLHVEFPNMFSSLLPRPKHSNYNPDLHYRTSPHSNHQINNTDTTQVIIHPSTVTTIDSIRDIITTSTTTYDATIPLKVSFPNLNHNFPRPPPDVAVIAETRAIFAALLEAKLGTQKKDQTTYINYKDTTTTHEVGGDNNAVKTVPAAFAADATAEDHGKIIKIETMQEDPLLPPKHKLRKNRHERHDQEQEVGPILKPSAKVTKEDRQKWNIPAAISNWKNNSGFTIALDKRVIGVGGGGASVSGDGGGDGDGNAASAELLNVEKFSALNQALNTAEVQARQDITRRNELRQQLELNEKRQREEKIREIANRNKRRRY